MSRSQKGVKGGCIEAALINSGNPFSFAPWAFWLYPFGYHGRHCSIYNFVARLSVLLVSWEGTVWSCAAAVRPYKEYIWSYLATIAHGPATGWFLSSFSPQNMLNITNSNFYLVTAVQLHVEVLHQSLVVGKTIVKTLLNVSPLQSGQVSSGVSCISF